MTNLKKQISELIKKKDWTSDQWKNGNDIERLVYFISQLSPHNLWKGEEAINDYVSKALDRMEEEMKKKYLKDDSLKYLGKWILKTKREIVAAQGYTPGEKQVALMKLRQIEQHFEVAKLIRKDIINSLQKEK